MCIMRVDFGGDSVSVRRVTGRWARPTFVVERPTHVSVSGWRQPDLWTACVAYTCPSNPRIPTVVRSCHGIGSVASCLIVNPSVSQQIVRLTMVLRWTPRAKFGFPRAASHGLVLSRVVVVRSNQIPEHFSSPETHSPLPCLHPPSFIFPFSFFYFLLFLLKVIK